MANDHEETMIGLNCGSGQRPFDQAHGWCNIDTQARWNPDIVGDYKDLSRFDDGNIDIVVNHHGLEHEFPANADQFIKEAYRVLTTGGSLLVFVPDVRALCQRWMTRQITDEIFFVNIYGAYMGDMADTHKWNRSYEGWCKNFMECAPWSSVGRFDHRAIPGADIAGSDFWIMELEAIK